MMIFDDQQEEQNEQSFANGEGETQDQEQGADEQEPGKRQARCTVSISQDILEAHVVVMGEDGVAIDPKIILDSLAKERVKVGLDKNVVARLASSTGRRNTAVVVARGKRAIQGESATIKYMFDENPKLAPNYLNLKDGKVDWREAGIVQQVKKGDLLAVKTPPTNGTPGVTVTGARITPRTGTDQMIKKGDNTEFEDEERTRLMAAVDGCVAISQAKEISVSEVYLVDGDVDLESGNIRFSGSVTVNGDVKDGFKLIATKDIEIRGVVEDAYIHCGGNITVRGGFVGTGKGIIRCGGEAHLLFLENQNLISNKDVYIAEEIIHGSVVTGGSVFVKFGKGAIIGGSVRAGMGIEAKKLGNVHYQKTRLEGGYQPGYDELTKDIRAAIDQAPSTKEKIQEAVSNLLERKYKNEMFSEEHEDILQKLYDINYKYDEMIGDLKDQLDILHERRLEVSQEAYVQSTEEAFPGVDIIIDDARRVLDEEFKFKKFIYANGMINAV